MQVNAYLKFFPVRIRTILLFTSLLLSCVLEAQLRKIHQESNEDNFISTMSFYSGSQGYVAFRNWIGYTTDSGKTYTQRPITLTNVDYNGYTVNVTFGFIINGVRAFSADTLIAYGHYGLVPSILYSVNGGLNFKLIFHDQFNPLELRTGIQDLCFPQNGNIGYAVDADRVLKTTNRGLTWTKIFESPGAYFDYIEPVDNNTILITNISGAVPRVLRISSGGSSFTYLTIPNTGRLTYASFISSAKGWISIDGLNGGLIYYTSNSGTSWSLKNNEDITPVEITRMRFVNDSVGYATHEDYLSLKTTDSGRTWEPLWRDNAFSYLGYTHNDFHIRNNEQIWFGGDYGFLELGLTGGQTRPAAFFKVDTVGSSVAGTVKLINYSKTTYQFKWLVNGQQVSTSYNASYTHDIYKGPDTIMLVASNGTISDTTIKIQPFIPVPYPAPTVTTFTPSSGGTGTVVSISGSYFANVQQVYFGDVPASSFTVNSLGSITATVGAGSNGSVKVTTATGSGSKSGYVFFPPPHITGFSPLSGPIGTVVTITGQNFSAVPSENAVFFGTAKSEVLSASLTQLVVKVPIGTNNMPIYVRVNKYYSSSANTFNVTFPGECGITIRTFDELVPVETNFIPNRVKLADFDQDGKPDLLVGHFFGFTVIRNTSQPRQISYGQKIDSSLLGNYNNGTDAMDIDGDGYPELVVTTMQPTGKVTILKNISTPGIISFGSRQVFQTGREPYGVTFEDLDNDGRPDMVVALYETNHNRIAIFRNNSVNGIISFERKPDILSINKPTRIIIRDLNGDGKKEILALNHSHFNAYVLPNTSELGEISFGPQQIIGDPDGVLQDFALTDFNNDGKLDIVTVVDGSLVTGTSTKIYLNTSTGSSISFGPKTSFAGGDAPRGVVVNDFDGDGKPDIIGSFSFNRIDVFQNRSTNTLNFPYTGVYYLRGPLGLAEGDFDSDGKTDLISTEGVYRNILTERGSIAGKDTSACLNRPIFLGAPSTIEFQYAWTSNPPGFTSTSPRPEVSPTVNTQYKVAVTNLFGCVTHDTVNVTVTGPPPLADAGPITHNVCRGDSLTIGTAALPGLTYSWRGVNGFSSTQAAPRFLPTVIGPFIVTASNGVCSSNDTTTVVIYDAPPANAGPDKGSCLGIGTTIGLANVGGNTYQWTSNPAGFTSSQAIPFINPTVNTRYYLAESNGICTKYDTVNITIVNAPVANAGADRVLCKGTSTLIGSTAVPGITYSWTSNPAGFTSSLANPSVTPSSSTRYFLRASNSGCTSYDTVEIIVPPTANAGSDKSICVSNNTTIGSAAVAGSTYSWTSIPSGFTSTVAQPVVSPTVTTTYLLTLTHTSCNTYDSVIVTVNPALPAGVTLTAPDSTLCTGASLTFTAIPVNGGSSPSYQWKKNDVNTGTNSPVYTSNTLANNDKISVTLTSNGVCVNPSVANSHTMTITVLPNLIPEVTISGTTTVIAGQSTTLTAASINAINPLYAWYDSTASHNWALITSAGTASLSYKPSATGDAVRSKVSAVSACNGVVSDTSNVLRFVVNVPTATIDLAIAEGISFFPNPVSDLLIIDSLKLRDQWREAVLYSFEGRKLRSYSIANRTRATLSLSEWPAGHYTVLLIRKSRKPLLLKFIKQ